MPENFDVVVIGGGTGGLVTASGCVRLGRRVALIEREALGGDCLWTGCVPTKALVASAKLAHQMRHADAFGLEPVTPRVTPKAVMDSMREQRRVISRHDDPEKFRKLGIDVIEGAARLTGARRSGSRRPHVAGEGHRHRHRRADCRSAGRRSGRERVSSITSRSWTQDEFPASLLILGGGYIGIEFAQMFAPLRLARDCRGDARRDHQQGRRGRDRPRARDPDGRRDRTVHRLGGEVGAPRGREENRSHRTEERRGARDHRRRSLRRLRTPRQHREPRARSRRREGGAVLDRGRPFPADHGTAHLGLRRRARRPAVHARGRVRGGEARAQHALPRQVGRRLLPTFPGRSTPIRRSATSA